MNITETTPSNAIVIAGLSLSVFAPIAEGHVCTVNEAAALNQTFAENIRNNFAGKVKAAVEDKALEVGYLSTDEGGKVIGDMTDEQLTEVHALVDLSEIQAALDEYQREYEFGARRSGSGAPRVTDPVEIEALGIARQKVRDAIKAKGHKLSEVGTEKINELAKQVLETYPQIREQAKSIVAARKSVALENLEL